MEQVEGKTVLSSQGALMSSSASLQARKLSEAEVMQKQIEDMQRKHAAVIATANFAGHFVTMDGVPHDNQYEIDGALLRAFGLAMEARMRNGNFPNWHTTPAADLLTRAKAELDAGNFIDAGVLAAMAHAHQSLAS